MTPFDIARNELEGADPESGDQEDDRKQKRDDEPLQPDEDEDEPLQRKKRRIKRKRGEDANE